MITLALPISEGTGIFGARNSRLPRCVETPWGLYREDFGWMKRLVCLHGEILLGFFSVHIDEDLTSAGVWIRVVTIQSLGFVMKAKRISRRGTT